MKSYQKSLLTLALGFFSALAVWAGVQNYLDVQRFPSLAELRSLSSQPRAHLLDRAGRPIEEMPSEKEQLYWVPLAKISPDFVESAVRALDPAFFRHSGVDPSALIEGKVGSISSEAAKFIRGWQSNESALKRFLGAFLLEREWSKDEILEAYFNLVSFGPKLQGVEAASRQLLGKEVSQLTAIDSAILAGALRSQGNAMEMDSEKVAEIACLVFAEAHPESGAEVLEKTCVEIRAVAGRLGEAPLLKEARLGLAPELAERVAGILERGPLQTSIDREAQIHAHALLREAKEGALIVLENRTGDAWVYASLDPDHGNLPVRRLPAERIFLPFLIGMGLEERVIQWRANEIRDSIQDEKIMDVLFHRLGGASALERKMQFLGLHSFQNGAAVWPSSLGLKPWYQVDTNLEEVTQAYLVFARQGTKGVMRFFAQPEKVALESPVFSPGVALQVANGLGLVGRAYWQSSFSSSIAEEWAWSVGFTTRFTIGVLARTQANAEILRLGIADYLHADDIKLAEKPTKVPAISSAISAGGTDGLDALSIRAAAPIRPAPQEVMSASKNPAGRIRNPRDGSLISLRMNTPIRFRMEPYDGRLIWVLNGRTLGTAKSVGTWRPSPGDWRLTLRDASGKLIDEVLFEVR